VEAAVVILPHHLHTAPLQEDHPQEVTLVDQDPVEVAVESKLDNQSAPNKLLLSTLVVVHPVEPAVVILPHHLHTAPLQEDHPQEVTLVDQDPVVVVVESKLDNLNELNVSLNLILVVAVDPQEDILVVPVVHQADTTKLPLPFLQYNFLVIIFLLPLIKS